MDTTRNIILILILFSLILPIAVGAVEFKNPLDWDTFEAFIGALIDIFFNVSLAVAPLMIIVGAFYFMVPGEKAENIEIGKKIIFYTLIGFIIILMAKGMIEFLRYQLIEEEGSSDGVSLMLAYLTKYIK